MTQYVALGMRAIPHLHKLLFWVDINLLYDMFKFDSEIAFIWGGNLEMLIFPNNSCYKTTVHEQRSHRGLVAVDEGTEYRYSAWIMQ